MPPPYRAFFSCGGEAGRTVTMVYRNGTIRRWRAAIALGLVSLLALAMAPAALAQDASPAAGVDGIEVSVMDADGNELGVLTFTPVGG